MKPKMKKFKELREKKLKGKPGGETVYKKKINGISLVVTKEDGMFCTYVDGDKLDEYPTLNTARKAWQEFIKAAQGK